MTLNNKIIFSRLFQTCLIPYILLHICDYLSIGKYLEDHVLFLKTAKLSKTNSNNTGVGEVVLKLFLCNYPDYLFVFWKLTCFTSVNDGHNMIIC